MAPRARLPRAERRAQLIGAAATAFLAGGYDGTSMDDVAHQAGVTRLIVYRNFDSKPTLYRAVLDSVLFDLAATFADVDITAVRDRGAVQMILPVARRHPDAFRLLWLRAAHEPEFAGRSELFRERVVYYAHVILRDYLDEGPMLEWAALAAGTHLVDGICHWLDLGEPARDEEFAGLLMAGIRALAEAWSDALVAK